MENKFDTDEQIRNVLRDFEAIPDSRSFDAILEKVNRKKKRRRFIIFFWTGLIALSGITVPLAFFSDNAEKPSALTFNDTHTDDSSTHTATSQSNFSDMHADQQTKKALSSDLVNPSKLQATKPKTPESATAPGKEQKKFNASAAQISLTKPHSENINAEEKNKPNILATSIHPETTGENGSVMNAFEKPEQALSNTSKFVQKADTITVSGHSDHTMYMIILQAPLPVDSVRRDVIAFIDEGSYPGLFMVPEKKKTFAFYIGASASPQFNSFGLSVNPDSDPTYQTSGINFPDAYLNNKKSQSRFNFSIPFGMKAGVQINNTYEIYAGIGYQCFAEKEKLYAVGPTTIISIPDSNNLYSGSAYSTLHKNSFRYLSYSLEANRLFQISKVIGFKLGIGCTGNQLLRSEYAYVKAPNLYSQDVSGKEQLSPWLLTAKIKAGIIFNPNRRFQFHISPGFFYSPTSVFKKGYVIRQKPYGFDVECMMLFRLFRI